MSRSKSSMVPLQALVKSVSMQIRGPLRASSSHDFYSDDPAQAIRGKIFYLTVFRLYCYMTVWDLAFSRLEMGPDKGVLSMNVLAPLISPMKDFYEFWSV